MSPPDFFTVDYAINPWMRPGEVDWHLAQKQWDSLKDAIEKKAGAQVEIVEPVKGLPDLVFTANAAFVYKNKAIIANYRYPERQPESPHCAQWFESHGFETIILPDDMFFEGAGDALIWRDRVFAGYRTRTDIVSHNEITKHTGLPVLSLELVTDDFYHIDVCICPTENEYFMYYPQAFDAYGNAVIEANIPKEKLIPVTPEEARAFACNTVAIGETIIFNQSSERLIDVMREKGFQVIPLDMSEFLKSGGSTKCLTLRLPPSS